MSCTSEISTFFRRLQGQKLSCIAAMNSIQTTIRIGEDCASILSGLLSRFVKGQHVRVMLTVEPTAAVGTQPDLVEWLLACPEKDWFAAQERGETTDELEAIPLEA